MHIALITDGISPYVLGGMQKHSFYLAKYFAKNGIYVDLIHYNESNYDIQQLEFFTEEEKKFIHSIVLQFPTSFKFPGHYIYNSYRYSQLAYNSIKEQLDKYDFIYAQGFTGWRFIIEKKKNKKSPLLYVNFHGYEMFQPPASFKSKLQNFLLKSPTKYISRNANFTLSFGGNLDNILFEIGIKKENIIHSNNGIDNSWLSQDKSFSTQVRKFVFIGRYERRKGIEELNDLLKELITTNIPFSFDFVGPIPEEKKITSRNVTYYGIIKEQEILKSIIKGADVLVCPSHAEGMPTVILEAMAMSTPVIATDVGAVNEMVNNYNGWLIEAGNSSQLKRAVLDAINSPNQILNQKGKNAFDLVCKDFIWSEIVHKFIQKHKENVSKL
ncbi:MAG: glycosyltransferase family 4 protein [Bacteroidia bacterium]|nr:glycosyltransferase family 4 protein [Bacteroidia bacterium]